MSPSTSQLTPQDHRFTPASRWVLFLALALVLVSAAQIAYRFTLPTDGWVYTADGSLENTIYVASQYLLPGTPEMRPGDELVAIGTINLKKAAQESSGSFYLVVSPPPDWQAGHSLAYTVRRAGQEITLQVPIRSWDLQALMPWSFLDLSNGNLLYLLTDLMLFGLGLLVFFRRPQEWSARALLVFTAASLAGGLSSILPDFPSANFDPWANLAVAFFNYWQWGILYTPTLFVFSLVFPQPKPVVQRLPGLALLPYTAFWIAILVFGIRAEVGWGLSMVFFGLSVISLVHSAFTMRDFISRAQIRWVLGGFLFAVLTFLPVYPVAFGWLDPHSLFGVLASISSSLAFPVFTASLAIAILRFHLYDIDIIIRRTLQYTILTAVLALVYFGGVLLLQRVFGAVSGEQSSLAIVLSTLAIAALFNPLRLRLQKGIDRLFFRAKFNTEHSLQDFSQAARTETSLENLTGKLVSVVDQALQPESITIWVKKVKS